MAEDLLAKLRRASLTFCTQQKTMSQGSEEIEDKKKDKRESGPSVNDRVWLDVHDIHA
jgi:hypothetical protein